MKRPQKLLAPLGGGLLATSLPLLAEVPQQPQDSPRPNVVLIVCDDLNDYLGHLGGHPQARTPHMDKLAAGGVSFPLAYCNNPICAPSRASMLTGIHPHVSGNYFFDPWYENTVLANSRTLMEHFRENGYRVAGTGKVLHHDQLERWPEYGHTANHGPWAWDGTKSVGHPSVPEKFRSVDPLDGSFAPLSDVPFGGKEGRGWSQYSGTYKEFVYVSDDERSQMPDEMNAEWAARFMAARAAARAADPQAAPFFLAVGFVKPHTPMYAPKKYFDMFPLDQIQLPAIQPDDAADTHYRDIIPDSAAGPKNFKALAEAYGGGETGLRRFLQAYLACTAFVDDQIGAVLDALERSGLADDTIVVLTSDNGWVMGEKDYLGKDAAWESSARVPLIIRAPGVAKPGGRPPVPVSLIDIYPTLVDLCGLPAETRKNGAGRPLDGHSLRPLLADPEAGLWDGPDAALTHVHAIVNVKNPEAPRGQHDPLFHHYSLRSRDYRYIRYNDGEEELYDHRADPREWRNLAADPDLAAVLEGFRAKLREQVPDQPWRDQRDIVSVQVMAEGGAAPGRFDAFGAAELGTVSGNWNAVAGAADSLLRGNGAPSGVRVRVTPDGIEFAALAAAFPHGCWAVVFDSPDDTAGYRLLGGPGQPLRGDALAIPFAEGAPAAGTRIQLVAAEKPPGNWFGYPVNRNGFVDTGRGYLGWLWVGTEGEGIGGWRYAVTLGKWIYLPDANVAPNGAWFHVDDLAVLQPDEVRQRWFYSKKLNSWVLSRAEAVTNGPGWVFVMKLSE